MKPLPILIIAVCTCLPGISQFDGYHSKNAPQLAANFNSGYNVNYKQLAIGAGIDFKAHGFSLNPNMIVNTGSDKPALFGLKIGYEYSFGNFSLKAGYGRYFEIYTTDKYDSYLNGWQNVYFVSAHWDRWFVQYDYVSSGCSIVSFGVRETLAFLQ